MGNRTDVQREVWRYWFESGKAANRPYCWKHIRANCSECSEGEKYMLYDPPEGWKFGFPKEYKPLHKDEPIEETLRRDGYPEDMMDLAKWTRFIGDKKTAGHS